jgi:murein DD-endopeptidase MepM/ murein hydrolase activator NlpD
MMRNVSFLVLMGLLFSVSFPAMGAVDVKALKRAERKVSAPKTDGQFFKALDPRASFRGAVKTFAIKVVPNVRPEPKEKIQVISEVALKPGDFPFKGGSMLMPVSGEISSLFGLRPSPFRRRVNEFHSGIDIRAKTGTMIRAAAPGKVIFSGWKRGYGLTVEIDHGNGLRTVYAHCSRISTRTGSMIAAGSPVGDVGRTGLTTGSHLHFEVLRGKAVLNPLNFVKR